jgi:diacylglycerol kinase family enzyme
VSSPFGPLVAIVDGGPLGVGSDQVDRLAPAFAEAGLEATVQPVATPRAATEAAARTLRAGGRFVVAVGGDAHVADVVNGMFADGATVVREPVIGVIAAGVPNDLVKSFGLPSDVEGAVGHLRGDNTYALDAIKIAATPRGPAGGEGPSDLRYAVNVAFVGLAARTQLRVAALPAALGRTRRFLGFWTGYLGSRAVRMRVEADMKTWEGRAFQVVIGNGQFADGGYRLSPRSYPGDGILDALVFHGPKSEAYTMLPAIFRHGDHIPHDHVKELRAKIRFAISSARPMPVVADGRLLGTTPATFQVVPGQLLMKL